MKITEIKLRVWLNIGLIILLIIFILQNLEQHKVKFLFFPSFELPIFVIIAVSFFIGFYSSYFRSLMKKSKKSSIPEENNLQQE